MQRHFTVEAIFTSRTVNGQKEYLVKSRDTWAWMPENIIANLNDFTLNLNPLTCLLNDSKEGKFHIKERSTTENEMPKFDFPDETDETIYVINPFTQTYTFLPNNDQPASKESKQTSQINLDKLYQMAGNIAVDE